MCCCDKMVWIILESTICLLNIYFVPLMHSTYSLHLASGLLFLCPHSHLLYSSHLPHCNPNLLILSPVRSSACVNFYLHIDSACDTSLNYQCLSIIS